MSSSISRQENIQFGVLVDFKDKISPSLFQYCKPLCILEHKIRTTLIMTIF